MQTTTRQAFNAYRQQLARLNSIEDPSVPFHLEPSVQQRLETLQQESSAFLSRINMVGVREQEGEKLGLRIGHPIASTTDTTQQDRQTQDPTTLSSHRYRTEQTNFDTHLTYAKLDAWAKFGVFQTRIRNSLLKRQALDRLTIGFHSTHHALTSDPQRYPLLEDVNIGWLQHYRLEAPERVLSEGQRKGQILIGEGGDYANLDALVFDAVNHLIDPWYQDDTALVAICGRELLQDKYFPLINQNHRPSDTLAADLIISQKRLGHLPAVQVPNFLAKSLLITRMDNLSLYWQEGSRRRTLIDNAKRDRIEHYESSNDAYVVEDFGADCLIDHITLVTTPSNPSVPAPPQDPSIPELPHTSTQA